MEKSFKGMVNNMFNTILAKLRQLKAKLLPPSDKTGEPSNEVLGKEYYIENRVRQRTGHVKANSHPQFVEYVHGTLNSYRNVLTLQEFYKRLYKHQMSLAANKV